MKAKKIKDLRELNKIYFERAKLEIPKVTRYRSKSYSRNIPNRVGE